jgi:hypothetical protein
MQGAVAELPRILIFLMWNVNRWKASDASVSHHMQHARRLFR